MLIAAAELAGAGKTTSLEFLAAIGCGIHFYVGGIVQAEVAALGLNMNPENERIVREALRSENGMAAHAERAAWNLSHQSPEPRYRTGDEEHDGEEAASEHQQFCPDRPA